MSYLGNNPSQQAFAPAVDYFNGNASTVAFTLSRPVASVAQVQVTIENVPQNPSSSFTVSGSTITFTSAPPSGTSNIYVQYTSPITQVVALPQDPQVFGNLQFSSVGARITGDFNNGTAANQVSFQNSTANSTTIISAIPSGTGVQAACRLYNNSDPTNAAFAQLLANGSTDVRLVSSVLGTGTYLPMTFYTGGSERARIDTSGNVGIGTSSPTAKLNVSKDGGGGDASQIVRITDTNTANGFGPSSLTMGMMNHYAPNPKMSIAGTNGIAFCVGDGSDFTTQRKVEIDSSGSLLVGTTSKIVNATVTIVGTTGGLGLISGRQTTNTAGKYFNWGTSTDANPYWIVYNESNVGVYLAPGGNTWTSGSDETIKENLKPIENSLNSVLSLRTVIGNYTTDPEKVKHPFLIAQDVQKVLPEAVSIGPDGKLGLQYTDTIPLLTAAIQELKAIIDTQATRITALEAK